jgi:hypothetical protein
MKNRSAKWAQAKLGMEMRLSMAQILHSLLLMVLIELISSGKTSGDWS